MQFKFLKEYFYWAMAPFHINLFSRQGLSAILDRFHFQTKAYYNVDYTYYWTKAIADKLNICDQYQKWRKDPEFVKFDIYLDCLFDNIASSYNKSTSIICIAEKLK